MQVRICITISFGDENVCTISLNPTCLRSYDFFLGQLRISYILHLLVILDPLDVVGSDFLVYFIEDLDLVVDGVIQNVC